MSDHSRSTVARTHASNLRDAGWRAQKRLARRQMLVQDRVRNVQLEIKRRRALSALDRAVAQNIDEPGSQVALQTALDDQRDCYDVGRILGDPPQPEFLGQRPTDVFLLRAMSYHLLMLEIDLFREQLSALLDNLETRTELMSTEEFDLERLEWWCTAVQSAAGFLHVANRQFLYRHGLLATDESTMSRMERLVALGLTELDRRFGRSVNSPDDWALIIGESDAGARGRLAGALNYLARDSFAHESRSPLPQLVDLVSNEHFDILMTAAALPIPPFSSGSGVLFQAMSEALEETTTFFTPGTENSYLSLMNRPHERSIPAATMFSTLVKAAFVFDRRDLVERLQTALRLENADLARVAGRQAEFVTAQVLDTAGPTTDGSSLATHLDDVFGPPHNWAARLERARLLHDLGAPDSAFDLLPTVQEIPHLTLANLFPYLDLVGLLADRIQLSRHLLAVGQRLRTLRHNNLRDVNFAGRVIQYSNLVEDHLILENSNAAFDWLGPKRLAIDDPPIGERQFILFVPEQDRVTPALMAPLTHVFDDNAEFRTLTRSRFVNSVVKDWEFSPQLTANAMSVIGSPVSPLELTHNWIIDPKERLIECDGVNYFEGIYERIARILKVFTVDWTLPAISLWLRRSITLIDRIISALDAVRSVAEERQFSVKLVTLQSHFAPFSAIRAYCAAHPTRLEHVTLSSSYENWRTNVGGAPLSTLTILNNTKHPSPSMPAFGLQSDFDDWLQTEFRPNREHFRHVHRELTSLERAGRPTNEARNAIRAMGRDMAQGKLVFCVLGKIPYDLGVPYQGGPAHDSMADWLNHTVDVVGASSNSLYVKPHPHELNLSLSAKPIESFVDLIERPRTPELTILPHRGINVQDLLSVVDVFLCWNGSSIAELGSQGAKVLAADDWAARNYPLNVSLPTDREHYEKILLGEVKLEMSPDFQELSEAYVCFMSQAPFAIRYPFVHRSSTNTQFNRATVEFEALTMDNLDTLTARKTDLLTSFGLDIPPMAG